MLTALSTGHDGSLCTVHAGSPAEALRRIEVLALMSDVGLPHAAIREQTRRRLRSRRLPVPHARGPAPDRLRRRGHAHRRRPSHPRALRLAEQHPRVALPADRAARRPPRPGRVMAAALAFAAAAAAVVGVWELLAAVEKTRPAAFLKRVIAPVVRAGTEGAAPTLVERRRLAVRRAPRRCAVAGWFVGGIVLGRPRRGDRAACSRPRSCGCGGTGSGPRSSAAAPNVARALADALSGGHSVRGRADRGRHRRAGRGGSRAARGGERAAVRRAHRGRARAPAAPGREPAVGRDGRRHPAPARRRRRPVRASCATSPTRSTPPPARTATRSPRSPRRASPRAIILVLPARRRAARRARPPGPARRPARATRSPRSCCAARWRSRSSRWPRSPA